MADTVHGANSRCCQSPRVVTVSVINSFVCIARANLLMVTKALQNSGITEKNLPPSLPCDSPDKSCIFFPLLRKPTQSSTRDLLHRSRHFCARYESWHQVPGTRHTSICCIIVKLCIIAMAEPTHLLSSGASSQFSGRLTPGRGHAGHRTANSYSQVPRTPVGSWPLPPRFNIFTCRHCLTIRIHAS